jgi:hypothetical protein
MPTPASQQERISAFWAFSSALLMGCMAQDPAKPNAEALEWRPPIPQSLDWIRPNWKQAADTLAIMFRHHILPCPVEHCSDGFR